jgi:hypothetical protein
MRLTGNTVKSVYDDRALDLYQRLGTVTVTRFSNVEFDNTTGVWIARRLDGEWLCEATTREECLAMEKTIARKEIGYVA